MNLAHVKFTLSYDLYLSDQETRPRLRLWISRDISNSYVDVELDDARLALLKNGSSVPWGNGTSLTGSQQIYIQLPLNEIWRKSSLEKLQVACQTCSLSLAFMCIVKNKYGEQCANQCGDAIVYIHDLPAGSSPRHESEVILPNSQHKDKRKGRILLSDFSLTFTSPDNLRTGTITQLSRPEREDYRSNNTWALKVMDSSMNEAYKMYHCDSDSKGYEHTARHLHPRWSVISDINTYAFVTKKLVTSAATYLANSILPPNPQYFYNALLVVLRREGIPEEKFVSLKCHGKDARKEDVHLAGCILAQIISLYSCYCNYLLDSVHSLASPPSEKDKLRQKAAGRALDCKMRAQKTVDTAIDADASKKFASAAPWTRSEFDRENVESFDFLHYRHFDGESADAGDCEDFSLAMMQTAMELMKLRQRSDYSTLPASLRKLVQIRRRYYFCMCLSGVGSATVDFAYGTAAADDMGAHMFALQIPRHRFWEWWTKANGGRSPIESNPELLLWRNGGDTSVEEELDILHETKARDSWYGTLILEGTGFLHPDPVKSGEEDAADVFRDALEKGGKQDTSPTNHSHAALWGVRKWHCYSYNEETKSVESPFYRAPVKLLTVEMIARGIPVVQFAFVGGGADSLKRTRPPENLTSWNCIYGILFEELITGHPSIAIWAEHAFEPQEILAMKSILKDLPPIPIQQPPLPASKCKKVAYTPVWCEELKKTLLAQNSGEWSLDIDTPQTVQLIYFIKYFQMTPDRIKAIAKRFSETGIECIAMSYNEEHVQPEIGGAMIKLQCKRRP